MTGPGVSPVGLLVVGPELGPISITGPGVSPRGILVVGGAATPLLPLPGTVPGVGAMVLLLPAGAVESAHTPESLAFTQAPQPPV